MRRLGLGVVLLYAIGCSAGEAAPRRPAPTPSWSRPVRPAPADAMPVLAATAAPAWPTSDPPAADAWGPLREARPVASVVREVYFGDSSRPTVALTFDDGPSRENTPRILNILARHEVPATFFVIGRRAELMPDIVERTAAEGHELGNHAWSHLSLRSMIPAEIRRELDETNAAIEAVTGLRPALFRPPFGRYAPSALAIVGDRGMNVVLWSVDSHDWESNPEEVARRVVADADAGDIILLHDNRSAVVHALPEIISGIRAKGLALVTVSELTGLAPIIPPRAAEARRSDPAPDPG